jgi:hypothetical protein
MWTSEKLLYTINGNVGLRAISKIYAVLDSAIFVSDGETRQIQFVILGEVETERNVQFMTGL